jgi:hypothetical protein
MRTTNTMHGYGKIPNAGNSRSQSGPLFSAVLKLAVLAGMLGFPVLLFVLIYGLYAYFYSYERILPGIEAGGVQLAGKTIEEAALQIHNVWNVQPRISVMDGVNTWDVPPYELGIQVDPVATAAAAHRIGRGGVLSPVSNISCKGTRKRHS